MLPRCRIGTAVIIALCRADVTNKSERHRQRVTCVLKSGTQKLFEL